MLFRETKTSTYFQQDCQLLSSAWSENYLGMINKRAIKYTTSQ